MRLFLVGLWAAALAATAAERRFDFSELREGQAPPGFRSAVMGLGKPGDWRIVLDDAPSALRPLTPQAPVAFKRPVLAQAAQDPTDEHFPLFIFEDETYGDFSFTTQFKTVSGKAEQMAGIAFRVQNETNYYVVRASSLGNTFRFYKVLNGERGPLVGPEIPIPSGAWHELTVECTNNAIRCLLDGKEQISVTDKINPLLTGRIAFWTKSDSVSYFCDARIHYVPHEPSIQKALREFLKKYPRLQGLQIFVAGAQPGSSRLVASKNETEIGRAGGRVEREVLQKATVFYGKEPGYTSVVMPLRDRNGDPVAAVRVIMRPFSGQTEIGAINQATPIVKNIQAQVQSIDDLVE